MREVGVVLIFAGIISYLFPGFNGVLFERSNMSVGEAHILGAVLFVGGLILIAIKSTQDRRK
jgi:hypothetical protein